MVQEQKPRERSFISELVTDWRPTRRQILWMVRCIIVLVVVLGALTLIGLPFDVTLWDWLKLLVIPVVLALGGYLFTRSENQIAQAAAERRAQDDALQAYMDRMEQLLLDKGGPLHQLQEGDEVRTSARTRTLNLLTRLDGDHKGSVVQFLYEESLITKGNVIVNLSSRGSDSRRGANLRGANLSQFNLYNADLQAVDLRGANLSEAFLSGVNLSRANLRGANLYEANLTCTILDGSELHGADLSWTQGTLKQWQLESAEGNSTTILPPPEFVQRPNRW